MADIGSITIEWVSIGFFAWKFWKISNFGFSRKNKWVSSEKKLDFFCQNRLIWQVGYTIRLKLCFYSKIIKSFRFWIFWKVFLDFFKNAKVKKKLLSASRNVLMLISSQNVQDLDFLEEKTFFWEKSLIFSENR